MDALPNCLIAKIEISGITPSTTGLVFTESTLETVDRVCQALRALLARDVQSQLCPDTGHGLLWLDLDVPQQDAFASMREYCDALFCGLVDAVERLESNVRRESPLPYSALSLGKTYKTLFDLIFRARNVAEVELWLSTDGGPHWRRVPLPSPLALRALPQSAKGGGVYDGPIVAVGTSPEVPCYLYLPGSRLVTIECDLQEAVGRMKNGDYVRIGCLPSPGDKAPAEDVQFYPAPRASLPFAD